jgi:hypothetical protein
MLGLDIIAEIIHDEVKKEIQKDTGEALTVPKNVVPDPDIDAKLAVAKQKADEA